MKTAPRTLLGALALAAAVATVAPADAHAQASQLDAAQASEFLGDWDMPLNTEYGSFDLDLSIADQGGKVAVSVGSPDMGGMQSVTNVTRSGDNLVLSYEVDAQGQMFPVTMTLKRDGEALAVSIDAGGGAFYVTGKASRATS
jgi:hypothetical protein